MKIWLVRSGAGWLPADREAYEMHEKMSTGECAYFKVMRSRSVPMHRKYMGICRVIGENQDPPRSESSIDYEIRILGGHFEVIFMDGHECKLPKRIAFEHLTHDEWMAIWPSLEQAGIERFGLEYWIQEAVA